MKMLSQRKEVVMQERWYVLPLLLLFGVSVAAAEGESGSGSQDRSVMQKEEKGAPAVTSASGIAAAREDQPVKLRGRIVSKKGANDYVFADDTGNAVVAIDSKVLKGKPIPAGTDVEIEGQVDTSFFGRESKVEAKWVTVLAPPDNSGGRGLPDR
jgi:uncharacterized protein (TIGR00156 family)